MARSALTNPSTDLIEDSGGVLWSFVKGEQLEYPIVLDFLSAVQTGYTFECVVIEASNFADQLEPPKEIRTGGVQTILTVRVPEYVGTWTNTDGYNEEQVVLYSGKYYRRHYGGTAVDAVAPDLSPYWAITSLNTVYVQFPMTLGATWAVVPKVNSPSYGFFELRVTENFGTFRRTWKPVRGMVSILFSPTEEVA